MLNVRWHKVIRDIWRNKTRTVLVALAIAVGIFAFGSVFITGDVLVEDMNNQYRESKAPNIIISTSSFNDELVRWAARQPGVAEAQGRAAYSLNLISGAGTYNLTLYAYDDFENMNLNSITPETGTFPPERQEIVFERRSIGLAKAGIGENTVVEMSNGRRFELKVAGTVHDINVFPANMFPQPTGYVSARTLEWLGFPSGYNQLNIMAENRDAELPELEKLSSNIKEALRNRGFNIYSVTVQRADQHWAKTVFDSFTIILSVIGIFSLILSGFLVINTITAFVSEQKRQVGVMKAVGGTAGQITGVYIAIVVCYGLIALLIALPVGMGLGYYFTKLVADLLNLDIQNFHLPLRVFLMEAGASLVVPVVSALFPIMGGVRVTVSEALSTHGINGKHGISIFDRVMMKITCFPRPVLLSLRNTFRRKARLLLTLGALTLAGTLFLAVMNVRISLVKLTEDIFVQYFDWEVALSLEGNYDVRGIETRVERFPGVLNAEGQALARAERVNAGGSKGTSFNISGVSWDSSFVKPNVNTGRWLRESDTNTLVLSSSLAKDLPDLGIGDRVTLQVGSRKAEWEVIGFFPLEYEKVAYSTFESVSRARGTPGLTDQLYIATERKDAAAQVEMAKTIENYLKDSGIKVGGTMTRDTIAAAQANQNEFLIYFLLIMAVMSAVIGALGLAGMMSLNVLERTREIGVMRSIGASNGAVAGIVVVEGLIIGVISWAAAIPLSLPISYGLNSMLGGMMSGVPLPFFFSTEGLVFWLSIIAVISVVASLLPAYKAQRMSIRETLAYE